METELNPQCGTSSVSSRFTQLAALCTVVGIMTAIFTSIYLRMAMLGAFSSGRPSIDPEVIYFILLLLAFALEVVAVALSAIAIVKKLPYALWVLGTSLYFILLFLFVFVLVG